jgi:hypothetical protein
VPLGRVFVSVRAEGAMTIASDLLAVCAGLPASVTVTCTVAVAAVVGLPLTVHPDRLNPVGSAPVMEQP